MILLLQKLFSTIPRVLGFNRRIHVVHPKLHTGAAYIFDTAQGYTNRSGRMPAVVLLAGWMSNSFSTTYTELANRLRKRGYHTLQLVLRGHEGATGDINTVTRADHEADIRAAFEYLAERPEVDTSRLGIVGVSYGAYLMSCALPLRGVRMILLRAPALYPDLGWDESTSSLVARPDRLEWRQIVRTSTEVRALRGLSRYQGKLFIISSEKDEDIPKEVIESYRDAGQAASLTENEIAGATHSLSGEPREKFLTTASQWFEENYPAS